MAYLLDANIFIQAKNLHYGFDFCPAFWEWIDAEHSRQAVFRIEKVRDELIDGDDELAEWARARDSAFFLPPSSTTLGGLAAVSIWANGAGYDPAAVSTFLQVAHYFLVAHAHAQLFVVVSHEVASPSIRSRFPTRA